MDLQLGNLAFSMVVTVGGTAVGLAIFIFIVRRFVKEAPKPYRKVVNRLSWPVWAAVVALVAWSTFQTNTPRLTVSDHSKRTPTYEDGSVQNLNPNQKTDQQRVDENQRLFRENAIE